MRVMRCRSCPLWCALPSWCFGHWAMGGFTHVVDPCVCSDVLRGVPCPSWCALPFVVCRALRGVPCPLWCVLPFGVVVGLVPSSVNSHHQQCGDPKKNEKTKGEKKSQAQDQPSKKPPR